MIQGATDANPQDPIKALVQRAQQSDVASVAGLYELFYDKIFRYVAFKTGSTSDAEDMTEEVFLRMLESVGSFKWKGYRFSSWLFRIAHNLIVDYFRKKSRQKTGPLEEAGSIVGGSSHDMDGSLDIKLTVERVHQVMEGLTDLQREVMSFRFGAGLSVREAARATGKKKNAVKALQHAAIKRLRVLLGVSQQGLAYHVVPHWSRQDG